MRDLVSYVVILAACALCVPRGCEAALGDVGYFSFLEETFLTCSSDFVLAEPCTLAAPCERDVCENECTVTQGCAFVSTRTGGACVLYSECSQFSEVDLPGFTLVKGAFGSCGQVVVNDTTIVPDLSRTYAVAFSTETSTSCAVEHKLRQTCTASASCTTAECKATCDAYPGCTYVISTSAGACILYDNCTLTRTTTSEGTTFVASSEPVPGATWDFSFTNTLCPISDTTVDTDVLDSVFAIVSENARLSCGTQGLLDTPCTSIDTCSYEQCRSYCYQTAGCTHGYSNGNGLCMMYSSCASLVAVAAAGSVFADTTAMSTTTTSSEGGCDSSIDYCATFLNTDETCSGDALVRCNSSASSEPCNTATCRAYCDMAGDGCSFFFTTSDGNCQLFSACDESQVRSMTGTTWAKPDIVLAPCNAEDAFCEFAVGQFFSCVASNLIATQCNPQAGTECDAQECQSACADTAGCAYASINENGLCNLYDSCDELDAKFIKWDTFVNNGDVQQPLSSTTTDPGLVYATLFRGTPLTCNTSQLLSQTCFSDAACTQGSCLRDCEQTLGCNFAFSQQSGACFLYSSCTSLRTAAIVGNTFVAGTTQCGETFPNPTIEIPMLSSEYAVMYDEDSMLTCAKSAKLRQPCTRDDPCEESECLQLCAEFPGCSFVFSSPRGSCMLFDSCDETKNTTASGITYAVVANEFSVGFQDLPLASNEACATTTAAPIADQFTVLASNALNSCPATSKISQPCSSAAPCSEAECMESCTQDGTCNFLRTTDTGGCLLFLDCPQLVQAAQVGNLYERNTTNAIFSPSPQALAPAPVYHEPAMSPTDIPSPAPILSSRCAVSYPSYLGDGHCDNTNEYNTMMCGWDLGDCCEDSCESSLAYTCGNYTFACRDPDYSTCSVAGSDYLNDGYCDSVGDYNTDVCGWDGGDCCASTCTDSVDYNCGDFGFTCLDPNATSTASDCTVGFDSWLADGYCDSVGGYNTEVCNWDGGDCCGDTCGVGYDTTFDCAVEEIYEVCFDPDSSDTIVDTGGCLAAVSSFLGDGYCDGFGFGYYNTAACDWDYGDCCASTCDDGTVHTCAEDANHFECLDPDATDHAPGNCSVAFFEYLGDSYCDYNGGYNVAACGWDGGDCCLYTCTEPDTVEETVYSCGDGGYDCKDNTTCVVDFYSWLGDGYCDTGAENTRLCMWDGGDCCVDSCEISDTYDCSSASASSCMDPDFAVVTTMGTTSMCGVSYPSYLGDGHCDNTNEYNTMMCGWDLGDCCEDSCVSSASYTCGNYTFACRDPAYSTCSVAGSDYLNDGYCDSVGDYNTDVCGWDGGDCCASTCTDSVDYNCGDFGFTCLDPNATSTASDCTVGFDSWLADGYCDSVGGYNTEVCNWDGGDCCGDTCGVGYDTTFDCAVEEIYEVCLDPDSSDTIVGTGGCLAAVSSFLGDGYCDGFGFGYYNTAACDWDYGDCCASTCDDGTVHTCAEDANHFECLDPDATDHAPGNCSVAFFEYLGDSYCDYNGGYNVAACGWDGGDCCLYTCTEPDTVEETVYSCGDGGYDCKDNTTCVVDFYSWLGDGYCDTGAENTRLCMWDGGDCCVDSCEISDTYDCSSASASSCMDPDFAVVTTMGTTSMCGVSYPSYLGDGHCDNTNEYNTMMCGWDLGDCCEDSCVSSASYTCGNYTFACRDPDYSTCSVAGSDYLNDGYCDSVGDYNTDVCGWDGGDCCASTCTDSVDYNCGDFGFTCLDPNATSTASDCTVGFDSWLADGYCDSVGGYNTEVCNWDGGDCCGDTCGVGYDTTFDCAVEEIYEVCLDPDSSDTIVGTGGCLAAVSSFLGDGYCDGFGFGYYNTAACDWDYGDCCASTCDDGTVHTCAEDANHFECLDPDATDHAPGNCSVAFFEYLGDSYCDYNGGYNVAACGWDGGDCCLYTCTEPDTVEETVYSCGDGGYDCKDNTTCVVDFYSWLGDGYCDTGAENTRLCMWDGGDCCVDSCKISDTYDCSSASASSCMDPDFAVVTTMGTTSMCGVSYPSYLGDGHCDNTNEYNTMMCGWDLGDCCEDSCVSSASYTCGNYTFACRDPAYSTCSVAGSDYLNDGYCDSVGDYNTDVCGWDGGDCCASTCTDSVDYNCGDFGFTCLDPNATSTASDCTVGFDSWLADGYCDSVGGYNTEVCNWDGGDCCGDTCGVGYDTTFDCAVEEIYEVCLDPDSSDTIVGTGGCLAAVSSFLGDGYCDGFGFGYYNTAACDWDYGDCCASTCDDGTVHTCAEDANHFECLDPDATDHAPGNCSVAFFEYLGDSYCDYNGGYNVAACGWDGGDCCLYTCTESDTVEETVYSCGDGGYDCKDNTTCVVDFYSWLGDGYCDTGAENTRLCMWDGGDCCVDSCEISDTYDCSSASASSCMDPDFAVVTTMGTTSMCGVSYPSYLGDGHCDNTNEYNTMMCGWDLGDCCEDSCVSSASYTCGNYTFACRDPAYSTCSVAGSDYLNDGYCDSVGDYNTDVCGWDGGDCCASTCTDSVDYNCGDFGFTCLDPNATSTASDCTVGFDSWLADGYCDSVGSYNTEVCNWDGGDCCGDTCGVGYDTTFDCAVEEIYEVCLDPDSSDTIVDTGGCLAAVSSFLGDGYCDGFGFGYYNTAACDWDYGDCCASTCDDGTVHTCAEDANHFECLDPDATDHAPGNCSVAFFEYLGDSYCDYNGGYNVAACGWDGGDCCLYTCTESDTVEETVYSCGDGGYDCKDNTTCIVDFYSWLGDGYCDTGAENTRLCMWDGGDCCVDSCEISDTYDCSSASASSCMDPDFAVVTTAGVTPQQSLSTHVVSSTSVLPHTSSTLPSASSQSTANSQPVLSTSLLLSSASTATTMAFITVVVVTNVEYDEGSDYADVEAAVVDSLSASGLLDPGTFATRVDVDANSGNVQVSVDFIGSVVATADSVRARILAALTGFLPVTTRSPTSGSNTPVVNNGNTGPNGIAGDSDTMWIVVGVCIGVVVLIAVIIAFVLVSRNKSKQMVHRRGSSHVATPSSRANTYLQTMNDDAAEIQIDTQGS